MFRKPSLQRFGILTSFLFLLWFFIAPIQAQQDTNSADPFAKFGAYTEESDLVIHHWVWSKMLYDSVVVITPSSRAMSSTNSTARTGTKIRRGSRSAARFESNRVQFHFMKEGFVSLLSKYRGELENLPTHFPLVYFNKDEQLAYWLNLHNAIVMEQLAKRYPVSKLKKLRNGTNKADSLWNEKLVTVEGVPLSLNDIQNNILIRHWKSPMVLYGLYQGAIGGPNLPNRAFTGVNVHILLERSAKEFVNSNRGIKAWGDKTQVSMMYDWGKAAFPNWERDLGRHLVEYANVSKVASVSQATGFTPKLYDWSIADTKGGTLSAGPAQNTAANLLNLGPFDNLNKNLPLQPTVGFPQQAGGNANQFPWDSSIGSSFSAKGGMTQMLTNLYRNGMVVPGAYDSQMIDLLNSIKQKLRELPDGTVTSIECSPDDQTCPGESIDEGSDNNSDLKE